MTAWASEGDDPLDLFEVTLPETGTADGSARIVSWQKRPGDWVDEDEPICVVNADGLHAAVVSPAAGRVLRILWGIGATVESGSSLAEVNSPAEVWEATAPESAPAAAISVESPDSVAPSAGPPVTSSAGPPVGPVESYDVAPAEPEPAEVVEEVGLIGETEAEPQSAEDSPLHEPAAAAVEEDAEDPENKDLEAEVELAEEIAEEPADEALEAEVELAEEPVEEALEADDELAEEPVEEALEAEVELVEEITEEPADDDLEAEAELEEATPSDDTSIADAEITQTNGVPADAVARARGWRRWGRRRRFAEVDDATGPEPEVEVEAEVAPSDEPLTSDEEPDEDEQPLESTEPPIADAELVPEEPGDEALVDEIVASAPEDVTEDAPDAVVTEPEVAEAPEAIEPEGASEPDIVEPPAGEPEAIEPAVTSEPEPEAIEPAVASEPEPEPAPVEPELVASVLRDLGPLPDPAPAELAAFRSPAVRRLAAAHGIDLGQVAGTGRGGRVSRDDVLARMRSMGIELELTERSSALD